MPKYVWRDGWIEYDPKAPPQKSVAPAIWSDLPAYRSPVGTGTIEGRVARREDLKRAGCREVDPGERLNIGPKTEAQAAQERAYLASRDAATVSDATKKRLGIKA